MIGLAELPPRVAAAADRLLGGARAIFGDELVALYLYGSTVAPDAPARPADLDAHAIVARPPTDEEARRVRELQESIERASGLEPDVWWILLEDARRPEQPRHLLMPTERDTAWALRRASLLAGRCVILHGHDPTAILPPPRREEIEEALADELRCSEEFLPDERAWRYCMWGCCRIVYSIETGDVAVSKRAAAAWALETMPEQWHEAIRAAGRAYDGTGQPGDRELLGGSVGPFLRYCRARFERARAWRGAR